MLKVGTVLLLIMLIFAGVYSLALIVTPKTILSGGFEAQTGEKLEDVKDSYLEVLVGQVMRMGSLALASVATCFFVLFGAFRKAEKWAWWALLIAGVLAWGHGLMQSIQTGDMLNTIMHLIGAVIFLVGILLPVKAFFGKKA